MTKPAENNNKLVGMKAIRQHMNNVSEATATAWHRQYGMPIKKVGGIWIGDRRKLDGWFETFTASDGEGA
jgi:hypothetical protein